MLHLQAQKQSIVITLEPVPGLLYWGPLLDTVDIDQLSQLALGLPHGGFDQPLYTALIPEIGRGGVSHPGIQGHRAGQDWANAFQTEKYTQTGNEVCIVCQDLQAHLKLTLTLKLFSQGVLAIQANLCNTGSCVYQLERLAPTLPLSTDIQEMIFLKGCWAREFQPKRRFLDAGVFVQENYTGRTAHATHPSLLLGTQGFNEFQGCVYGFHLAWSGNYRIKTGLDHRSSAFLQVEEILLPGEVMLKPDQCYQTPWLYCAYSTQGMFGLRCQFHDFIRHEIVTHTARQKPRPVHFNTWEALYFDQNETRVIALAQDAAAIGVERFVLDDGWFQNRQNDRAGLGNWIPDPHKYPRGLTPVINQVHGLGMQFGLWIEPEMVSPDAALLKSHPDWILRIPGQENQLSRNQLVLDLQHPQVFEYLFTCIDQLLTDHEIDYLKWDMNRELSQAGHFGQAAIHNQVTQLYRLLAQVRQRHPQVEIESCASGGGRIDYAILQYCHRFWLSDNNDALERQAMYPVISCFFPPELLGAHVSPYVNPTSGRCQRLDFKLLSALFYHLGLECPLEPFTEQHRHALSQLIALYKGLRDLIHTGQLFFPSVPDASTMVTGIHNKNNLLLLITQLTLPAYNTGFSLQLPFLQSQCCYAVQVLYENVCQPPYSMKRFPTWLQNPQHFSGQVLMQIGLPIPAMHVEGALLVHIKPMAGS